MKSNPKPIQKNGDAATRGPLQSVPLSISTMIIAPAVGSKEFRRLKWHELVSRGDCLMDESRVFAEWDGPFGFRASSFIKPVYREIKGRALAIGSRL
jgi:hypothetical protein